MRDMHDTPTCFKCMLKQMTSSNFRSELWLGCTCNDARPLYVVLVSNSEYCGYSCAAESLDADHVQSIALQCLQRTKRKLPRPMHAFHRGASTSTANGWLPTDSSNFRLFFWKLNSLPNISGFFVWCLVEYRARYLTQLNLWYRAKHLPRKTRRVNPKPETHCGGT